MFLALDVGNSAVKGALFDGTEPARVFSASVDAVEGGDEPSVAVWTNALRSHLRDTPIDHVGMAAVVPATADAVTAALGTCTTAPVTRIRPTMPLPFGLDYETPDTLGTDRLAAAAAGWVRFGDASARSVIVVDAGTAVTCEVVHREGVYRGGTIAAGPVLTRGALRDGTAQLPDVPLTLPDDPIGRSTQTALQSGIMWGLVDGVRGMVDRLAAALPDAPVVVLTGGWAGLLTDHLERADYHRPHLVLDGVRLLAEAPAA